MQGFSQGSIKYSLSGTGIFNIKLVVKVYSLVFFLFTTKLDFFNSTKSVFSSIGTELKTVLLTY